MNELAILLSNACRNLYGRLDYVFNQPPHTTKTKHRTVAVSGNNVNLIENDDGTPSNFQSGIFFEEQFLRTLKKAQNKKKKHKLQSIIISFSSREFSLEGNENNKVLQIQQALTLIDGFAQQYFKDCQYVVGLQSDGLGGKLHAHLLVNTIKPNGRAVRTNFFNVFFLRKQLNLYLSTHFEQVTGRVWPDIPEIRQDINDIYTRTKWKITLKEAINHARKSSVSLKQFRIELAKSNVQFKVQGDHILYTINTGKEVRTCRDLYQVKDKQSGRVTTTKGLGESYTLPILLLDFKQNKIINF